MLYKPELSTHIFAMLHTLRAEEVFQEVLGLGLGPAMCIAIASNVHGQPCALLTFTIHTAGHVYSIGQSHIVDLL